MAMTGTQIHLIPPILLSVYSSFSFPLPLPHTSPTVVTNTMNSLQKFIWKIIILKLIFFSKEMKNGDGLIEKTKCLWVVKNILERGKRRGEVVYSISTDAVKWYCWKIDAVTEEIMVLERSLEMIVNKIILILSLFP
jgi:hypothetical protein